MKATLYKVGHPPVELSAEQVFALKMQQVKKPVHRLELDGDREQVAQVLGCTFSDAVWSDWCNVAFGGTNAGDVYNQEATAAVNTLIKASGSGFTFGTLRGPVLIVQQEPPLITGWACTKPGQVKHHYYTADGKSLCSYQRKPGPLHPWQPAFSSSRKIPDSACSSCELAYSRLPKSQQL